MGRVQGIMGSIHRVQHSVGTLVQGRLRYRRLAVQMTRGKANGVSKFFNFQFGHCHITFLHARVLTMHIPPGVLKKKLGADV